MGGRVDAMGMQRTKRGKNAAHLHGAPSSSAASGRASLRVVSSTPAAALIAPAAQPKVCAT